jgi:hypothetical protein
MKTPVDGSASSWIRRVAVVAVALVLLTVTIPAAGRTTDAALRADTAAAVGGTVGHGHPRAPGTVTLRVLLIAGGFACVAASLAASRRRWTDSTPRTRPCVGDVGHDWRALLLGAPPVRA